jgi:hypothetical protein
MRQNKHHYYLAGISLILLVFLSGCGRGGGDTPKTSPTTPFLEGSNGLTIDFLEGSPPEEVTDRGTFDFQTVVSLKNDGEFDLKRDQVKVNLIGILPEDFGVSGDDLKNKRPEDDPAPTVRDSEGNIIEGVETFVTFPSEDGFFNFNGEISGNTVFVFRADVCYKYQTKALSRICVLKDLVDVDDDNICDPTESKRVFSSSSPLGVSNFRQSVTGQDKISFSFDVVHNGPGDVFQEGDANSPPADCPKGPKERRGKENKVRVTINSGLPNLRCVGLDGSTTGFVTMTRGKRTITCIQELDPGRSDFETNVDIILDFNYLDNADQEVLVKHLIDP